METYSKYWENLPKSILILIFHHLDLKERTNASLCCKAWNQVLNYPLFWRSVCCAFRSEVEFLEIFSKWNQSLAAVTQCVSWLRDLRIECDTLNGNLESLAVLFRSLAEIQPSLRKFTFAPCTSILASACFILDIKDDLSQDLILSLVRFLSIQNCLTSCSILVNMSQVCTVLMIDALCCNSNDTLKILELGGHLDNRWKFQDLRHRSFASLVQLRKLTIHCGMLTEASLKSLAKGCKFLRLLVISGISLNTVLTQEHFIVPDDVWKKVSEELPHLGLYITFGIGMCRLLNLIPTSVPVIGMRCIGIGVQAELSITDCPAKSKNHLKSLELDCSLEMFSNRIMDIITSFPNLTMLKLMLASTKVIDRVVDWMVKQNIGLKQLTFLLPNITTEKDEEKVVLLKEKYKSLWKSHQCLLRIYSKFYSDVHLEFMNDRFVNELYLDIISDS